MIRQLVELVGKKTFYFTDRKKILLFTLLLPLLPLRLNKISELDE